MTASSPTMTSPMERFSVVLWEPQDPINVGSVVRVCRNTDVHDLRLVNPRGWNPDVVLITAPRCEAFIEDAVRIHPTFESASEGLHRLYALTARGRRERQQRLRVDDLVEELQTMMHTDARVGFVFGREDAGLPNDIVDQCDAYITLETSPDYASLNLAQAVLMVLWSVFRTFGTAAELRAPQKVWDRVSHDLIHRLMDDVEKALDTIGFFKGDHRDNVLRTVRNVLLRAGLDKQELATFWGIFKEIRAHDERRAKQRARTSLD